MATPELVMPATINVRALSAVSQFVSTEETRYYLNGVRLEIRPREVLYIATDGRRLLAYRDEKMADDPDNDMTGEFTVPTAQARAFKCAKKDGGEAVIYGDEKQLTIKRGEAGVVFAPIDGTYPDWRRVIPSGPLAQGIGQFDGDYLAAFQKFADTMSGGVKPFISHNGSDGAALVRFGGIIDAVGVIMPFRAEDQRMKSPPAWAEPMRQAAE